MRKPQNICGWIHLRKALAEKDQLVLHYQPKVSLYGAVNSVEASAALAVTGTRADSAAKLYPLCRRVRADYSARQMAIETATPGNGMAEKGLNLRVAATFLAASLQRPLSPRSPKR